MGHLRLGSSEIISPGIIWYHLDHLGSSGITWVWDHLRSSGLMSAHLGSSRITRSHLGSSGLVCCHLKCSSQPIWHHLGSSGTIWGHLGSAWVICSHLGSSELIWVQKLQYLSAKMQNSMFFVNFIRCFGGQVHQVLYLPRGPSSGPQSPATRREPVRTSDGP